MIAANEHPEPEETPDSTGGKGELLADPDTVKRDLRLVTRALLNGWKVPQAALETLPAKIYDIATKADDDPDLVLKAAVVLDKMEQTNARKIALAAGIDQRNPGVTNNTQINISFGDCDADEKRKRLDRLLALTGYAGGNGKSNGHPGGNGHGPNGHAG